MVGEALPGRREYGQIDEEGFQNVEEELERVFALWMSGTPGIVWPSSQSAFGGPSTQIWLTLTFLWLV